MIGERVGGYDIVELVGRGGVAEVYKAYDRAIDRFVAIKILLPEFRGDEEFRARFEIEAKSIALLEHLHILPLYGYGEVNGQVYLVMRYMPFGSLADYLEKNQPLALEDISRLLNQIASALDFAHERGILHRDLKTENILIDDRNNAYLADFGLVKWMAGNAPRLTGNFVIGTPAFMSPEQCIGSDDLTAASDQYALGVIAFNLITGEIPFWSENSLRLVQMQIRDKPPSPRSLRPELTVRAEQALLRTLAKLPIDRFESCSEFAKAFENALPEDRYRDRFEGEIGDRINNAMAKLEAKSPKARKSDT